MRRVVITGIGLVTPLGTGKEKAWKNLLEGECGIDKITQFDSSQHPVHIAGEVKDFVPENYIEKKELKKYPEITDVAQA
mgnify:CR=1 FL=1